MSLPRRVPPGRVECDGHRSKVAELTKSFSSILAQTDWPSTRLAGPRLLRRDRRAAPGTRERQQGRQGDARRSRHCIRRRQEGLLKASLADAAGRCLSSAPPRDRPGHHPRRKESTMAATTRHRRATGGYLPYLLPGLIAFGVVIGYPLATNVYYSSSAGRRAGQDELVRLGTTPICSRTMLSGCHSGTRSPWLWRCRRAHLIVWCSLPSCSTTSDDGSARGSLPCCAPRTTCRRYSRRRRGRGVELDPQRPDGAINVILSSSGWSTSGLAGQSRPGHAERDARADSGCRSGIRRDLHGGPAARGS